jgi:hypothetical protein
LRYTFNTNMRKAGVPKVITMKLTGHNTLSMYLKYSAVDPEDAKDAVAKLECLLNRESQTTANSSAGKKKGSRESA